MEPLDLRTQPPRAWREKLLGFCLPRRTIDKLRAELPGGSMGNYVNHDKGFSAFVVRRVGLNMNEFRDAVAQAANEAGVEAWLKARIDPAGAPALNAKLETFVVERMSASDKVLVRERHPVMAERLDLSRTLDILDILDADDSYVFGTR